MAILQAQTVDLLPPNISPQADEAKADCGGETTNRLPWTRIMRANVLCFSFAMLVTYTAPVAAADLKITGAEELVASPEDIECKSGSNHAFDHPASAYRREDGTVLLLAGNSHNLYFTGPSLDSVKSSGCSSLLESSHDPDPSAFRDNEWLFSIRSIGSNVAVGFVHDEFHGGEHGFGNCALTDLAVFPCWYGAVTRVISSDDAHSFKRPDPPQNVIAALPYIFHSGMIRAGLSGPKVVRNPHTGRVYLLATFGDWNRKIAGAQCLLEAQDSELSEWKAWDGSAFSLIVNSPYQANRDPKDCKSVIAGNVESVRYIPDKDIFLAVGENGKEFWYSFSRDLVTWDPLQPFKKAIAPQLWKIGDPEPEAYPSLLDPSSDDRNFDTLENRPYVYFVTFPLDGGRFDYKRRQLLRVPVKID